MANIGAGAAAGAAAGSVVLGKNGIEKIIDLKLTEEEKVLLETSAKAVKNVMNVLDDMKMF